MRSNGLLLCAFVLVLSCIVLLSCKKKRYNYKCLTSHSFVNNEHDYTFQRMDTNYLKDATTKEANTYERSNTIRNVNYGEDATSTVCTIMIP
jgi:hypothetical protein